MRSAAILLAGLLAGQSCAYDISQLRAEAHRDARNTGRHVRAAAPPEREDATPEYFSFLEMLQNWRPTDTRVPERVFDSLERLDYQKEADLKRAFELRDLELPFKLYNIPNINDVVAKWKDDNYVIKEMSKQNPHHVGVSYNAHHMYYQAGNLRKEMRAGLRPTSPYKDAKDANGFHRPQGYTAPHPPPVPVPMTFQEFWTKSNELAAAAPPPGPGVEDTYKHIYLTSGDAWRGPARTMISKDITIWRAPPPDNVFMVDTSDVRGQHCRFGMRGVIAEQHWDGHLNFVAMLRGQKRYILNPPEACRYMGIMDKGPSRRHAAIDFADPDVLFNEETAKTLHLSHAVETVLSEGEVLYIPSYWPHYIISLGRSIQCNVRSGVGPLFEEDADGINDCDRGKAPREPTADELARVRELIKTYKPADGKL